MSSSSAEAPQVASELRKKAKDAFIAILPVLFGDPQDEDQSVIAKRCRELRLNSKVGACAF